MTFRFALLAFGFAAAAPAGPKLSPDLNGLPRGCRVRVIVQYTATSSIVSPTASLTSSGAVTIAAVDGSAWSGMASLSAAWGSAVFGPMGASAAWGSSAVGEQ